MNLLLVVLGKADAFSRGTGKDWEGAVESVRKAFPEMKGLSVSKDLQGEVIERNGLRRRQQ